MEFLKGLGAIAIPAYLKRLIILLTILVGTLNASLFIYNLFHFHDEFMSASGVSLLSVVFPIFVALAVLWGAESGIGVLKKNTLTFLQQTIPGTLQYLFDEDSEFHQYEKNRLHNKGNRIHNKRKHVCQIFLNICEENFHCDYFIENRDVSSCLEEYCMVIRIEINVRKANVNLCFPVKFIERKLEESGTLAGWSELSAHRSRAELIGTWLLARMSHSRGGSMATSSAGDESNELCPGRGGYSFNAHVLTRKMRSEDHYCLVASANLAEDFLLNPAEKLFFAQDLLLFLRSCASEAPDLFISVLYPK